MAYLRFIGRLPLNVIVAARVGWFGFRLALATILDEYLDDLEDEDAY